VDLERSKLEDIRRLETDLLLRKYVGRDSVATILEGVTTPLNLKHVNNKSHVERHWRSGVIAGYTVLV
jgi:hypothetical protein